MSFGIFESAITSEQEVGIAKQAATDKMAAAIYDVRAKLGPALFAASSLDEFRDRVAMMKNDQSLFKIIGAHTPPITGTVRRIVGKNSVLEKEFRAYLQRRIAAGEIPGAEGSAGVAGAPTGGEVNTFDSQMKNAPKGSFGQVTSRRRRADSNWGEEQPSGQGWLSGDGGLGGGAGSSPSPAPSTDTSDIGSGASSGSKSPSGLADGGVADVWKSLTNGGGNNDQYQDRPAGGGFNGGGDGTGGGGGVAKPSAPAFNPLDSFNVPGLGNIPGIGNIHNPFSKGSARTACYPGCEKNEAHAKKFHKKKADFSGTQDLDQTFSPSDDELIPEDSFDGYLNSVDQGAESKVDRNFTSAVIYRDWCEANNLSPIRLSSLDRYADRLGDAEYMRLARQIQVWERQAKNAEDEWPSSHSPETFKGQPKGKLKDVTASGTKNNFSLGPDFFQDSHWSHSKPFFSPNDADYEKEYRRRQKSDPLSGFSELERLMRPSYQSKLPPDAKEKKYENYARQLYPDAFGQPALFSGEDFAPHEAGKHDLNHTMEMGYGPNMGDDHSWYWPEHSVAVPELDRADDRGGAYRGEQNLVKKVPHKPDTSAGWPVPPGDYEGKHRSEASRQDPMRAYINWCQANNLTRISARNVAHFAGGDVRLCIHLARRMKTAIRTARLRQGADESDLPDFDAIAKARRNGLEQKIEKARAQKLERQKDPSWPRNDLGPEGQRLQKWEETLRRDNADRQARRRTAAPDYLQKADDALTQLLNQKAEEFQQTIAPLQQALVTVQQAEQLQQQANPMNVLPPPGTVNVMPGQAAPGQVGQPDPSGGMDPNAAAAAALAGPLGGGEVDPGAAGLGAAPGGGAPDDQAGPPPAAGPEGALPPDVQQQLMARRRGGSGKG